MKNRHGKELKRYVNDLSGKNPSYGGGSVACFLLCAGTGLIEKSMRYSLSYDPTLAKCIPVLGAVRRRIFPYIDRDGEVFAALLTARGKRRQALFKKSQAFLEETAHAAREVFSLANTAKSGIKKSIYSDFIIGIKCLRVALEACQANYDANHRMFNRGHSRAKRITRL
jgi:formiminotetrahydrofolate cyclodeaminase